MIILLCVMFGLGVVFFAALVVAILDDFDNQERPVPEPSRFELSVHELPATR